MKYIDAEKLIAEIENIRREFYYKGEQNLLHDAEIIRRSVISSCNDFLFLIDSLQQERPSLPSNLDEAAQRIAYDVCKQLPNGEEKDGIVYYAILAAIAGAEWMAGQGYTRRGIARPDDCEIWVNIKNTDIKDGDKVVVQIRKK